MKIIVVGAGLSGLAAAWRLQEAGHEVQVLEAASGPGGRLGCVRTNRFLIDTGPEVSARSYHRFLAMARNAGIGEDEIVPCSPVASTLRNGKMIDIDTSRMTSLLFTPLLSWGAKCRLAWGLYKHRKLIKSADAFSLTDLAWFDDPASNAEEFAVSAFGREAADYLIDPLMRTIGGTHMSKVSALAAVGGLSSFSAEMVTVLGGLARVTDGIAAKLQVTYNARVSHIAETEHGVDINSTAGTFNGDACVIAAQYDDAERLWPQLAVYAGDYGKHLSFCQLMDVKLGYSAATHSKAYAAQVPTIENDQILMFALSHNKAPDRAPPGSSLFTVYTEHTKYDWFAAMTNDAIIEWGKRQIEALYPEIAGHFVFGLVTRQPKTVCFADPGFYRRTAALIENIPKNSRVQLAGDVFGAGSMEAAVVWGERAADRVLAL